MGVLVPILALLIPISAIVGSYVIKYRKLELENNPLKPKDLEELKQVIEENKQLKGRLENLEAIITGIDKELLSLKAFDDSLKNQETVQKLADKLKKED